MDDNNYGYEDEDDLDDLDDFYKNDSADAASTLIIYRFSSRSSLCPTAKTRLT
jgi:hypothetical protein